MAANKKPRKKYRPKGIDRQAHNVVLGNFSRMRSEGDVRSLMIASHDALAAFRDGNGNPAHLENLGFASNHALLLAEMGMGKNLIPQIQAGQNACMVLQAKLARGEPLTLDEEGLNALRDLLEIHEAQVTHPDCTVGAMRVALARVYQRQEAGDVLRVEVSDAPAAGG